MSPASKHNRNKNQISTPEARTISGLFHHNTNHREIIYKGLHRALPYSTSWVPYMRMKLMESVMLKPLGTFYEWKSKRF